MSTKGVVASGLFFSLVALMLFLCLFGNSPALQNWDVLGSVLRETAAVFRDSETQWMVFLCVSIYCVTFLFLQQRRSDQRFLRSHNSMFWLSVFTVLVSGGYSIGYATASRSTQALTLTASIAFGLGFQVCSNWHVPKSRWIFLTPTILICFLLIAALWQPETFRGFEYRGRSRSAGPWDNPNTFGLLMGTGVALAIGGAARGRNTEDGRWKSARRWIFVALCLVAAILMGRALLHSLSRGAWLATGCGLAYLIFQVRGVREQEDQGQESETQSGEARLPINIKVGRVTPCAPLSFAINPGAHGVTRPTFFGFKRNWFPLSVIALSLAVLVVWHFRDTDWHPARRALSVANANDFSWRNRVAAWESTLQMMAEKPWFGLGWNQPEPMYEHYYLSPRLTESAAIQMNDHLMLGATLGIPAVFCFGMYVWLALRRGASAERKGAEGGARHSVRAEVQEHKDGAQGTDAPHQSPFSIIHPLSSNEWLRTTCRAGAIVLLIGFWFDGGLFKLATASTFWILIELGRSDLGVETPRQEFAGLDEDGLTRITRITTN